jgi:beta-phosphoglucomutase family hydrolase
MDGVLVDTGEAHFQAWSQTLAERGIPFTLEQFQTTFGMNNDGILRLLLGPELEPELITEIGERKERLFRQAIKGKASLLPGVGEWLGRLKARGIKQAIASSAPPANIDALVEELDLWSYFDAIVSGTGMPGKPNPDVFLEAARQIGVTPEQCVVIEDAVPGVQAARNAGMRCIAVTTTNEAGALAAADIIVNRLDELSEVSFFE